MRDILALKVRNAAATLATVERSIDILRRCGQLEGMEVSTWRHLDAGLALIQLQRLDHPDPVTAHQSRRTAFSFTGYQGDGRTPRDLFATIDYREGRVHIGETTGIAAYFLADANQLKLYAFSSHAGVECVYFTEGPECIAISNRPLLSHLVGWQRDRPEMNVEWGRRALLAGSSLGFDTPFVGTEQSRPRSTVVVGRVGLYHQQHPRPLVTTLYDDYSEVGRQRYMDATLAATRVLDRLPPPEFRLSGGKDSRYLAALVHRRKLEVDAVTYAPEDAGEGPIARHIAQTLGLPHRTLLRQVAEPGRLRDTMNGNLARSDALPNECRQLAFLPLERPDGKPDLEGHAHHARGGFNMRIRGSGVDQLVSRLIGDREVFVDSLVEAREQELRQLADGYSVRNPMALGYWSYNDHRMPRWLSAGYLAESRRRPIVWPLMDDQVLSVTGALSPFDRNSEFTFFGALEALSPAAVSIPLYLGDSWRVDRGGADKSLYPRYYDERHHPLQLANSDNQHHKSSEKTNALVLPIFRSILNDGRYAAELRECIRSHALEAMLAGGKAIGQLMDNEGLKGLRINQVLWRVATIGLILEGDWF